MGEITNMKRSINRKRRTLRESKDSVKQNLIKIILSDNPEKEYGVKSQFPGSIVQYYLDGGSAVVDDAIEEAFSHQNREAIEAVKKLENADFDISLDDLIESKIDDILSYDPDSNSGPTMKFAEHLADVIMENYSTIEEKKQALSELTSGNIDSGDWLIDEYVESVTNF